MPQGGRHALSLRRGDLAAVKSVHRMFQANDKVCILSTTGIMSSTATRVSGSGCRECSVLWVVVRETLRRIPETDSSEVIMAGFISICGS
jgi:hypothetical protein